MTVATTDKKIIIMAANGFDENHMTAVQRSLTQSKLAFQVMAPEQGLVNGWQNNAWGHYFTVEVSINTAMGSDYDALIVIGGERGVAKLMQNPHARRIIRHFVAAKKPLAAIGHGVTLLSLTDEIANRTLAVDAALQEQMKAANVIVSPEALDTDDTIITSTGADVDAWAEATTTLINTCEVFLEEAA